MPERDIVVIGGSAGGLEAVLALVRGLPADLPAAIFVVIHVPATAPSALPSILHRQGRMPADVAQDGAQVTPGRIYVARPGCHLVLRKGRMWLTRGPKENHHRPAADPLFRSAAAEYGERVIGVVLSGTQNDGTGGLLRIKQAGGIAVVQDPEHAAYPGMPQSALTHVKIDYATAADQMGPLLVELVAGREPKNQRGETMTNDRARTPDDEPGQARDDRQVQPGIPSTQSCPECHGVLWEVEDQGLLKFRCRVGHAYTGETLLVHQAEQLEAALWTALRALEEHQALNRRLAARAATHGHAHTAAVFTEQAVDAEHHASVVRDVLQAGRGSEAVAAAETDPVSACRERGLHPAG